MNHSEVSPFNRSSPLLISPSESLWIGLCWGEFTSHYNQSASLPRCRFIEILEKHLSSFVPYFDRWKRYKRESDEIPQDIVWSDSNGCVGHSPSMPNKRFISIESIVSVIEWKFERKSILDCLVERLWDHMSLLSHERFKYATDLERAKKAFDSLVAPPSKNDMFVPSDRDSIKDIELVLNSLVRNNECEEAFFVGRKFGELLFAISDFEYYLLNVEAVLATDYEFGNFESLYPYSTEELKSILLSIGEEKRADDINAIRENPNIQDGQKNKLIESLKRDWESEVEALIKDHSECARVLSNAGFVPCNSKLAEVGQIIKSLVQHSLIKLCRNAESRLNEFISNEGPLQFEVTRSDSMEEIIRDQIGALPKVGKALSIFWLSFGEVLGMLRDADQDLCQKESLLLSPRSLGLIAGNTPDKVMERILKIEQEYSEDPSQSPENIVNLLGSTIEALARRVWPLDFQNHSFRGGFTSILSGRMQSRCSLDRRFASIALTLYKQYRCPQSHDMDSFHCTAEEARFFFAGIRALIQLWTLISKTSR